MSEVSLSLSLAIDDFKKSINQSTAEIKKFSDNASKNFGTVKQSFNVLAGTLAASAITKGLGFITGSFSQMISEAAGAEQSIKNMNVALQQAGLFSNETSQEFQEFADSIEQVTIYAGDAAQASIGLLATLTTLDKEGIKSATNAAADLAATLNIDLATASEMITKAINGNFTAFNKLGIQINKGSTDAERLSAVLAALSSQQGAAAAASNTFAGAIAKADNQKGKFLESIGKLITQNPGVIAALDASSSAFASMAKWIEDNQKFLSDLGTTLLVTTGIIATGIIVVTAAKAAFIALSVALATGASAFQFLGVAATAAWSAITAPITLTIAGIAAVGVGVYQLVKNWDQVKIAVYSAMAATIEYAAKATSIFSDEKAESLNKEAQSWRDKAQAIREAVQTEVESTEASNQQSLIRRQKLAEEAAEVDRINLSKSEQARIQTETLVEIENERQIRLAEIESLFQGSQLERRQAHEAAMLQLQIDSELAKAQLQTDSKAREEAIQAATDKAAIEKAKLRAKQEAEIAANRVANQKDTFATIATLSNSNNKTLATIGKAAGITQIAIDTPVAISKALAAFPPPFNFVAAGLVGTAMAAQAANIAGVKFAEGGIVPGSSMTGDKIQARLNAGEMVLNRTQQSNLFQMANQKQSGVSSDTSRVEVLLENLITTVGNQPVQIIMDGKVIFEATRNQLSSGRSF